MVHVDNTGIIDGLCKGEMKCLGPKAKDVDLWIAIREELDNFRAKDMLSKRLAPRRKVSKCHSLKSLSLKAMKKWMS